MLKRYNYRAYPSTEQIDSLAHAFGSARWIYNKGIEIKESYYKETGKSLPDKELSKQLPLLKKKSETAWLSEVSAVILQQSLADLSKAYKNFFVGTKKKQKVGKPKFKTKTGKQSFRVVGATSRAFEVRIINRKWGAVRLPKIGKLKFRLSRPLPSQPSSVTVSLNSDGTYHISFVIEVQTVKLSPAGREAGIDVGLNHFAAVVYSDGTREKINNPSYSRKGQEKLTKAQKNLSRKKQGSSNRNKARLRVARHHSAIRRQRLDFLHKLSSRLVNENQVTVVEGLLIKGLAKAGAKGSRGSGMRRSVHDASWSAFFIMLSQKALEFGREFVQTDAFFPSTRLCSFCGNISEKKELNVRAWSCDCSPDFLLDRDFNAAVNILNAGGHSAYGEDVRRILVSC